MDKDVFTLIALDESVPLGRIKPLDSSTLPVATHFYFYSFGFDTVCSPGLQAENKTAASATLQPFTSNAKGPTRATNARRYYHRPERSSSNFRSWRVPQPLADE